MISSKGHTLLLINNLGSGGAQRQLLLLARELEACGTSVTVMHYGKSDHMLGMLCDSRVKVIHVDPSTSKSRLRHLTRVIHSLLRAKPAHLISFIDGPNILAGVAAFLMRGTRWIPSERNVSQNLKLTETTWRRILYLRAHAVVPNSDAQAHWLRAHFPRLAAKVRVIKNGIPNEFFAIERRQIPGIRFLSLGRLSTQKDPWTLVKAIEQYRHDIADNVAFHWYGDDDPGDMGMRQSLELYCSERSLPIQFHRAVIDVRALLDGATALILCSRFEGTPNVVLEAMARRVPVIATKVADLPELLGEGRGILIEHSRPCDLRGALQQFLDLSSADVEQMVNRAYEYAAARHSSTAMAKQFESLMLGREG